MTSTRIAIVGAGIAGLACARALVERGLSPVIERPLPPFSSVMLLLSVEIEQPKRTAASSA